MKGKKTNWTEGMDEKLRKEFPVRFSRDIGKDLKISIRTVIRREIFYGRVMKPHDAEEACISYSPARRVLLLRNWRYFSREFVFAPCAVKKNFQGIFSVIIPDDVEIIPRPEITAASF